VISVIDDKEWDKAEALRDSRLLLRILDRDQASRGRALSGFKPLDSGIPPDAPFEVVNVGIDEVFNGDPKTS
jgi:hypothetical protein